MTDENGHQNLRKLSEAPKPHETLSETTPPTKAAQAVAQPRDIDKLRPNINAMRDITEGLDVNKLMPNITAAQHFTPRALPSAGGSRMSILGDDHPSIKSPIDLGHLLRKARIAKKLSQQEFADLAGVGRRFVSEAENGKATLEFGKVLQLVAAAGIDLFAKQR